MADEREGVDELPREVSRGTITLFGSVSVSILGGTSAFN
jgi:hypothetical protein